MSRLTEWIDDGETRYAVPRMDLKNNGHRACCNKLAHYEDLAEQGRLLELPCKPRDRFWELNNTNDIPHIYPRLAHSLQHCVYVMERLGKTTFLTKEEAEKALEEMREKDE